MAFHCFWFLVSCAAGLSAWFRCHNTSSVVCHICCRRTSCCAEEVRTGGHKGLRITAQIYSTCCFAVICQCNVNLQLQRWENHSGYPWVWAVKVIRSFTKPITHDLLLLPCHTSCSVTFARSDEQNRHMSFFCSDGHIFDFMKSFSESIYFTM